MRERERVWCEKDRKREGLRERRKGERGEM